MTSPAKFFRQVRQETAKVTWPTRKETVVSTITVIVLMVMFSLFFMAVDAIIATGVEFFLGLGG